MLEASHPSPAAGNIALAVSDPALLAILTALLTEWRHPVADHPDATTVVLLEDGCPAPRQCKTVIPMGRSTRPESGGLALPLVVEALWAALEPHFHKPPRRHIRIGQQQPALVTVRGQRETTRLVSLSDLGTRFSLERELVNGEPLELDLKLGDSPWILQGRVIYAIPRGDHEGSYWWDTGMLFLHGDAAAREGLRGFIVASYLRRVAHRLPYAVFRAGLDHLQLPGRMRELLLGSLTDRSRTE
jgi:PilZ domain